MNKNLRLIILISNDICLIFVSTYLALIFRSEKLPVFDAWSQPLVISIIIYVLLFYFFKLDREYFKYFNFLSLKKYFYLFFIYTLTLIALLFFFQFYATPRTIGVIQPPIFFVLLISSRYLAKEFIKNINIKQNTESLIILGDVSSFDRILNDQGSFFTSHILVNLNLSKSSKRTFQGKRIYSSIEFETLIPMISKALIIIDEIYLDNSYVKMIKNLLVKKFRFLSFNSKENKIKYNPLDYHQFLFDEYDFQINKEFYQNKTILITGAGGSVGRALTYELAQIQNTQLILIDHSEFNLFKLNQLLANHYNYQILLINVLDKNKLAKLFDAYSIDIVIHAAAYKHVHILQNQEYEAVENNYLSTKIIYELCLKYQITNFLFISTDKAVRPTSVMGVSKRIAEIYLQQMSSINPLLKTTIIRFGNVLDSSGSALPIFLEQIQKKQAVTVTHKEVQRYFMSLAHAAKLVLEANSFDHSGIFHLDMGKPIKIYNLAQQLIKIHGYHPTDQEHINDENEMSITEIGLFEGEKLYEELLIENNLQATANKKIFESIEKLISIDSKELLKDVDIYLKNNDKDLFAQIKNNNSIFFQSN